MKILFIGDIYGNPGIDYLLENITKLRQTYHPNIVVANAENAANGRGLTKKIYKRLMEAGIGLLTMGNHTWKNPELATFIDDANIIRPINDGSNKGMGYKLINYNGKRILIMNAVGQAFMNEKYSSPFTEIKTLLETLDYDYSFLDFHAETTSEKIAMAYFLEGKVDAVVGTHTHVQTQDARMLSNGTLFLTDVGMTGPLEGVIGVKKEIIIDRFVHGESRPNEVALGKRQLNACLITLHPYKKIETIHLEEDDKLM